MKNGDPRLGGQHFGNGGTQPPASGKIDRKGIGLGIVKSHAGDPERSGSHPFLYISILLVGSHSMILGMFIYFFTDIFYKIFFSTRPDNIFFVKQSGIFLFCLGAYYFLPFMNFQKLYNAVLFTIFTKIVAVLFLVFNSHLSLSPTAIYLAAAGDASMAVLLSIAWYIQRRNDKGEKMAGFKT
jgi:hypothetical protein